jgi:hypothetical protein
VARKWYDKAVEWTEKNQPGNPELRRFGTEAAALLKIAGNESTTTQKSNEVELNRTE